jgi:hypothetical protein
MDWMFVYVWVTALKLSYLLPIKKSCAKAVENIIQIVITTAGYDVPGHGHSALREEGEESIETGGKLLVLGPSGDILVDSGPGGGNQSLFS